MNSTKTILLVEDDIDIREALQQTLEMEGYTVITAGNGREGIDVMKTTGSPDLILLDLMMPIMTGWEFLEERMRDDILRLIPVVVVSAVADRGQNFQANAFLKKPIELNALIKTVQAYCG